MLVLSCVVARWILMYTKRAMGSRATALRDVYVLIVDALSKRQMIVRSWRVKDGSGSDEPVRLQVDWGATESVNGTGLFYISDRGVPPTIEYQRGA